MRQAQESGIPSEQKMRCHVALAGTNVQSSGRRGCDTKLSRSYVAFSAFADTKGSVSCGMKEERKFAERASEIS